MDKKRLNQEEDYWERRLHPKRTYSGWTYSLAPDVELRLSRHFAKIYGKTVHPLKGETCVYCKSHLRPLAALFFDRVWMPPTVTNFERLREIAFYMGTDAEMYAAWRYDRRSHAQDDGTPLGSIAPLLMRWVSEVYVSRQLRRLGVEGTIAYTSFRQHDLDFKDGASSAFQVAIANVDIIHADHLSWDQVVEMRKDPDSLRKLRTFKRWILQDMKGQSLDYIKDEICMRIADYQYAIKKHGLETAIGTMSSLLDSKFLTAATVGGAMAALSAGGAAGVGTGLALGISKVAIEIAKRRVTVEHVKRTTNPEIAFVLKLHKNHRNP